MGKPRWFRFSLRTLVLGVLLIGGARTLSWNWEPWVPVAKFEKVGSCSFANDGALIRLDRPPRKLEEWAIRIYDARTLELVDTLIGWPEKPWWGTGGEKVLAERRERYLGEQYSTTRFSPDGRTCIAANENYSDLRESQHTAVLRDAHNGMPLMTLIGDPGNFTVAGFSNDSRRLVTYSQDRSRFYGMPDPFHPNVRVFEFDTSSCLLLPHTASVREAHYDPLHERILVGLEDDTAQLWRRRRPEYWWGVAWLPEFWLTVLLAAAFGWSVWRDRKSMRG